MMYGIMFTIRKYLNKGTCIVMKYFKTKASKTAPKFEITLENFDRETHQAPQFYKDGNTKKPSRYAICPSCLNPIQIVGLVQKSKVRPYGRHTGKNIDGLPQWNYQKYRYCPYAAKTDSISPYDDWTSNLIIDKEVVELYNLLKTEFDRVVYVISKELGISCSNLFWEKALKSFLSDYGYTYLWLTAENLPYIFAFLGMQHKNIFGQSIAVNSPIYNALKGVKGVHFEKNEKRKDYAVLQRAENAEFICLKLRFYGHKQKGLDGEEVQESIMVCIDDNIAQKVVYEKKLVFNQTFFLNLIKADNTSNRNEKLLNIAAEQMTGIEITDN